MLVNLESVDNTNVKNALESKLQLDMTNWKCTGRQFDVEVALNGGCVTVVFLHGCLLDAAAPLQ